KIRYRKFLYLPVKARYMNAAIRIKKRTLLLIILRDRNIAEKTNDITSVFLPTTLCFKKQ
ncbi:hypothetical protein, partial [Vibrio parahaemolyticus]|uniref:hypothetical protein n=1 Tax=Vibrio parahaemolyticus TaxID=670 RepID=UPI001C60EC95